MSLHLMECVRPLRLNASTKLVLLAFADSADSATNIAFPGADAVMEWANVSRSRSAAIIAELVDAGLLARHSAGRRGRRAEYVVFPNGCCPSHPRPAPDPDAGPVAEYSSDASVVHLYAEDVSLSAAQARMAGLGPADGTLTGPKGSCGQDSVTLAGSCGQDPNPASTPERVLSTGPFALKGSCLGPAHGTPSLTTTTTPQPPPAPPAGVQIVSEAPCAAHAPAGAPNCRGCGTTPRALRRAAQIAAQRAVADARLAAQAERAAARAVATGSTTAGAARARAALEEARS